MGIRSSLYFNLFIDWRAQWGTSLVKGEHSAPVVHKQGKLQGHTSFPSSEAGGECRAHLAVGNHLNAELCVKIALQGHNQGIYCFS